MGMINITLSGSFKLTQRGQTFFAQHGGHAKAIGEAIHWLSERLPEAVEQDHMLHEQGVRPNDNFGLPR